METFHDVLGEELKVLFVGFNPSPRSAEVGHHYAGRNNQFWRLLFETGMTPRLLSASEDRSLPRWGSLRPRSFGGHDRSGGAVGLRGSRGGPPSEPRNQWLPIEQRP